MVAPELLEWLRCPVDGQSLVVADDAVVAEINRQIAAGQFVDASGGEVGEPIDGGLMTIDRVRLHAIRGGIPTLIPGEAFPLAPSVRSLQT